MGNVSSTRDSRPRGYLHLRGGQFGSITDEGHCAARLDGAARSDFPRHRYRKALPRRLSTWSSPGLARLLAADTIREILTVGLQFHATSFDHGA